MKRSTFCFICGLISLSSLPSLAAEGGVGTGGDQVVVGGSLFIFGDEASQGGKTLPGGTSTYLSFNLQYNRPSYYSGVGLFYNMNSQGESQTASAFGLKLELFYKAYYFEYGFGVASQTFTNRSIESRDGSMSMMGLGIRVELYPWLFFDGSFKKRNYTFSKEDGSGMPASIQREEFMPFLGLGTTIKI